jgi:hypothetical protein
MTVEGSRQRVAALTLVLEYPDGQLARIDGKDLMAEVTLDMPDYGIVGDAQDVSPFIVAPARVSHLVVDITLDLRGKLTVSGGAFQPRGAEQAPAGQ